MSRKRLLILGLTDLSRDPRIDRQISGLKEAFEVTSCGFRPSKHSEVPHIKLEFSAASCIEKVMMAAFTMLGFAAMAFWVAARNRAIAANLSAVQKFDIVLANDIESLPLALYLKRKTGAKVHFDAHEWYAGQFQGSFRFYLKNRWADLFLARNMRSVDSLSTVSQGIAALYRSHYGKNSILINNSPILTSQPLATRPSDSFVRMVHHGAANPNRGILEMIEFVEKLDSRFTLDLVLMKGDPNYYSQIEQKVRISKKVRLLVPWDMKEIVPQLKAYDIGLFLFQGSTINLRHTLPNKFFEFMHAGLAVIAGPGGEMGEVIERYDIGIRVSELDENLIFKMNSLQNETLLKWKKNALAAAAEFDGAKEVEKLQTLFAEL